MSRRRGTVSVFVALATLSYACSTKTPTVSSRLQVAASYADADKECVSLEEATASVGKLCWRPDPGGRGTELSVHYPNAQCIQAKSGESNVGYTDASDEPDRRLVELDTKRERPAFVLAVAAPAAMAAEAKATGGTGGADTKATSTFGSVAARIGTELRIEVFDEPCEALCKQRAGLLTVVATQSGLSAFRNDFRAECGFFDIRAHNRSPATSASASARPAPPAPAPAAPLPAAPSGTPPAPAPSGTPPAPAPSGAP